MIRRYSLVTPGPEPLHEDAIVEPSADVAQLVEHQLPKLRVAGSNPVVRLRPPGGWTLARTGASPAHAGATHSSSTWGRRPTYEP